MAKFKPGKSGNPAGRPMGSSSHQKLRSAIIKNTPSIIEAMIEKARTGDTAAAKILLDRVIAPMKSGDTFIDFTLNGDLSQDARNVLNSVGASEMSLSQGVSLLGGIASLARIVETDELLRRIEKLEANNDKSKVST